MDTAGVHSQTDRSDQVVIDRIPTGLVPSSGSLNFTETTIPNALQRKHELGAGHWGVLHVFEGSLRFANLTIGLERSVKAPDLVTIHPQIPHKVIVTGPMRCRIDFFREPDVNSTTRTPGAFADDAVRRSFERCEHSGNYAETFYDIFLGSSPEVARYFHGTDFDWQRKVLRDSVHMLVTRDVAEPRMREMLERLGQAHGRGGRNIPPDLYELWLNSVCEAAKSLDPDWHSGLEKQWRVRLRPGMQIIMAAY